MEYRRFGNTDLWLSGLGFGMNRFPPESLSDEKGIQNAAELLLCAIKKGVNYIDTAKNYSNGKAFSILRRALEQAEDNSNIHVCIKMMLNHTDKTSNGAFREIKEQLQALNIGKADLCFMQAVKSYDEYQQIIRPGGLYEGFEEAKKEGLIEHICLSSHASTEETIRIMEEGKFEGYTLSYHLLNCVQMRPVLDKAQELGAGVLTMNSLAGGLIPENPQLFRGLSKKSDEICQMAIQYIYSHPAVTSVLSGMQSLEELDCNVAAIENIHYFKPKHREYFEKDLFQKNNICTGCNYCKGCPKDIPIKSLMYSYNALKWDNGRYTRLYCRDDESLIDDIRLTQEMMHNGIKLPMPSENPCISCRLCEAKCTQSLPIVERIQDIYQRIDGRIVSQNEWESRLKEIKSSGYRRIAFYPNCATTRTILEDYYRLFGEPEFQPYIIDRNEKLWGGLYLENEVKIPVAGLDKIMELELDCIIITHYMLQDTLYENVKQYVEHGVEIRKLYKKDDLPIVYLGG